MPACTWTPPPPTPIILPPIAQRAWVLLVLWPLDIARIWTAYAAHRLICRREH